MCLRQIQRYEPVRMDSFEPPISRRYAFQQMELMEAGWDRRAAQRIVDTWLADEIKCAPRCHSREGLQGLSTSANHNLVQLKLWRGQGMSKWEEARQLYDLGGHAGRQNLPE